MDKTGEKFFRVYKEADLPGFDFSEFKPAKGDKEDFENDENADGYLFDFPDAHDCLLGVRVWPLNILMHTLRPSAE